ncbi:MAG: carboxypeptidase-like regulatory domain-containing protein [Candidatus Thalassarchaeaceae archaeon]|nr:carboxypeptidase-like regulatory domain-containing protein [Candidatus Thalassarchaeaceae archaeon]
MALEEVESGQSINSPGNDKILTGLPEVDDEATLFTSSGASILLSSDQKRHPMVFWLVLLLVITSLLGFVNGADYVDGDSGIINHRNFIYRDAERAAPGTAVLLGQVVYEDGTPAYNHTVKVTVRGDDGSIFEKYNTTDENGNFRINDLDPGLQILIMANDSRGTAQLVEHEILLSAPPPFAFEPYGFTTLKLVFPADEEFNNSGDGTFVSYVASEAENNSQLYDESAAGMYVMVGVGFSGLAVIALGATWLGWRENSLGMLRMATIFAFFSQGPYSSACCLGLLAFILTFALPKPRVD